LSLLFLLLPSLFGLLPQFCLPCCFYRCKNRLRNLCNFPIRQVSPRLKPLQFCVDRRTKRVILNQALSPLTGYNPSFMIGAAVSHKNS
jgi:hypothetical protein